MGRERPGRVFHLAEARRALRRIPCGPPRTQESPLSTYLPGSSEPLRRISDLAAYFEPPAPQEGRVGVEWELLPLGPDARLVPYGGRAGLRALLEGAAAAGWQPLREARKVVALRPPGGGLVGLEPGGQVELASEPAMGLAELERFFSRSGRALGARARSLGFSLEAWGAAPNEDPERLPDVPKVRYGILGDHLRRTGDRGRWMMKLTASTQVALDYLDERHLRAMTDGALRVLPYLYAATANAPVALGRRTGAASFRAAVWRRTDPRRCGLPAHLFSPTLSYASAARWALSRPPLFFVRGGRWIPGDGRTFAQLLRDPGPLGALTQEDWALHISGLFPDIRLRGYFEVRVLDSLPLPLVLGSTALLKGLLSERDGFRWAAALPPPSPRATRGELTRAARLGARWAPREGPGPLEAWPRLLKAARDGLRALGDDPAYLEPLAAQVASRRAPAEAWARDRDGRWRGGASGL